MKQKTVTYGNLVSKLKTKLKQEASPPELAFYKILKSKIKHFIWQKNFNGFKRMILVDFYIPKPYKLIIEIDGKQHLELNNLIKDKERDNWLIKKGYKVLRIQAREVNNFDIIGYLDEIVPFDYYKKRYGGLNNNSEAVLKRNDKQYKKLEKEGWIDKINDRTIFKDLNNG